MELSGDDIIKLVKEKILTKDEAKKLIEDSLEISLEEEEEVEVKDTSCKCVGQILPHSHHCYHLPCTLNHYPNIGYRYPNYPYQPYYGTTTVTSPGVTTSTATAGTAGTWYNTSLPVIPTQEGTTGEGCGCK